MTSRRTSLNIYTTKGRDRFHWAATPLKPYKVGNICYMTYRYSVLYFLNLSLKHFFCHRKRQFLWKYPNPETVIVPCFNAFAHAQLMNIYFQFFAGDNIYINKFYGRNTFTTKLRGRPFDSAGEGGSGSLCRVRIFISNLLRATIFIFIQLQHRPFILRYSLFESNGCRIIYLFS